ncbi:MAG: AMP-binding protein [Pseudomonadota bacterium]
MIDAWIADHAKARPDHPALIFKDKTWSYADFAARIDARAAALTAAGIARGDRVAWYGMNHAEVFTILFACARIGAVLVPLNWRLAAAEISKIVDDCGPKLIIYDDHFAHPAQALAGQGRLICHHGAAVPALRRDPPDPGASDQDGRPRRAAGAVASHGDDPLLIVYTSGSTGQPKGVVLAQAALAANAVMSVESHGLTPDARVLNVLPLFHVGGLNILPTPAFSIGATVELHEKFDPTAALAALERVSHAIMVPTVLQAIMGQSGWETADLSGLRALSIGSTDVPRDMIDAVQARCVPVVQIYGATETCPLAIYQRVDDAKATTGSIGRAGCACAVRLVGADGRDVPDGQPGEIWVKGANALSQYWRNPAETARSLTDGWFHTGDVAVRDADGLYWFADRIKHVVISGGENIYPAELERVLRPHPKIAEVAVVGRPDPKWGEIPVAVVVAKTPMTEAEVLSAFNGVLARYKHPKAVAFVDALPRNAMGKVVAADVRAMIAPAPIDQ